MNEDEATSLFSRTAQSLPPVSLPSAPELIRRGKHVQQRHRLAVLAGVVSAVALVVVGGLLIRPDVSAAPDATTTSPDGTPVAFPGYVGRQKNESWDVVMVQDGTVEALAATGEAEYDPSLSFDGLTVVFIRSTREGQGNGTQLVSLDLRTGKETLLLHRPDDLMGHPAISPSGNEVAYWKQSQHQDPANPVNGDLFILDIAAGTEQRITSDPAFEFWPVWSPDGTKIAFGRNGQRGGVFTWSAEEGERRVSPAGEEGWYHAAWSPDGDQLAMARHTGEILIVNRSGPVRTLSFSPRSEVSAFGWIEHGLVVSTGDYVPHGTTNMTNQLLDPSNGDVLLRHSIENVIPDWTPALSTSASNPPKQATVPNVLGMAEEDAKQLLNDSGLRPLVEHHPMDDVPGGTVTDQSPAGGNEVMQGSSVTLTVADSQTANSHVAATELTGTWDPRMLFGEEVRGDFGGRVNVMFREGRHFSAFDGCNSNFGKFRVQPDGAFEAWVRGSTLVACPKVEHIANVEAVTAASRIRLTEEELWFFSADGEVIGRYIRR